ncbi:hypothetical protein HO133_009146 [Letharia lupina]|uniref:Uncharacterized protein n=1 Tax=Letharia lupina TaxID=560253 RepID=A0A8H6FFC6_9LECA|nr:uncharacterized protein HO133_009146 [Letharia lupina]KAF6226280.1 hypothetical protein HO133_009146 [Letharia lupina]
MPSIAKTTTKHHCPKKGRGQGNCRPGKGYCLEHQMKCPLGHKKAYLKTEPCPQCDGDTTHDDRREAQTYSQRRVAEVANSSRMTDKGKGKRGKYV